MTPEPRYPLQPLAQALGITLGTTGGHQPGQPPTGITALAEATGRPTRTLQHWNLTGLDYYTADELACATGHHPADIWPGWHTHTNPNDEDLPEQPTLFHVA